MKRTKIVGLLSMVVGGAALVAALLFVRGAPGPDAAAATIGGPASQPGPPPGAMLSVMQATGTCRDCREQFCRDYLGSGVDIVAGCFEQAYKEVPNADPKFIEDCVAAVKCAYDNECGYEQMPGPFGCYCGSRNPTDCLARGPAPDAPCVEEWKRATRTSDHGQIAARFDDGHYPSGWAFAMIQCDREFCGEKSKVGRCTPP